MASVFYTGILQMGDATYPIRVALPDTITEEQAKTFITFLAGKTEGGLISIMKSIFYDKDAAAPGDINAEYQNRVVVSNALGMGFSYTIPCCATEKAFADGDAASFILPDGSSPVSVYCTGKQMRKAKG